MEKDFHPKLKFDMNAPVKDEEEARHDKDIMMNGIFLNSSQPIRYAAYLIWIQLMATLCAVCSLVISPVLTVITVGVGVPIMLAYVYGVVPLSLCRNSACDGATSTNGGNGVSTFRDEEGAYRERIVLTDGERINKNINKENSTKTIKSSFHQHRQSIASFGRLLKFE